MGVDEGFATSRGTTRDANRVARHATSDQLVIAAAASRRAARRGRDRRAGQGSATFRRGGPRFSRTFVPAQGDERGPLRGHVEARCLPKQGYSPG